MAGPEKKIQNSVVEWAREAYKGKMIARKFHAPIGGSNGWPDFEFLIERGVAFHIEFKRPGGTCTDLQLQRHAQLRAIGHAVFVVDDKAKGKEIIRTVMARHAQGRKLVEGS